MILHEIDGNIKKWNFILHYELPTFKRFAYSVNLYFQMTNEKCYKNHTWLRGPPKRQSRTMNLHATDCDKFINMVSVWISQVTI